MLNVKLMTVSLAPGEGVACNTILLQTIKVSIMTENNAFVSGLLGEKFRLEMMVPQRSKESPKTSEGLSVSLPVSIQGKQYSMKERGSRNSRVELKNKLIHQCQIPGQI